MNKRFEYKSIEVYTPTHYDLTKILNLEGQSGWEAVSIRNGQGLYMYVYFKREIAS